MLFRSMDGRKVILDPQALGSTICTASTTDTKSSDVFTTVMKKKFFNHMSEIASKILSGLTQTTQNLQNLYAYQLESKLPNSNKKPITDICAAAKRMIPTYASKSSKASSANFQHFLEIVVPNTKLANTAFQKLSEKLAR